MSSNKRRMSLVAGSYERFIWGFTLHPQNHTLTPLFSYPSHLSLIKTVAVSGSVVASGGSDDTIHLYDLSSSSSLGSLHQHSATVTSLSFYSPPHLPFPRNLVSADAHGSLSIFDADGFVHLKSFPVHRNAVNDLALHPSGKLALTVSRDHCLAIVNLLRGRRSFCCRLDKEASLVCFDDADGDTFFMAAEETVSVHNAEDARLLFELQCPKRVLCAAPARNGLLYTGGEDRNITAWDIKSGQVAYCIGEAHTARVKGIVVLTDSDGDTGVDPYLVASASSDGTIRVWDVRMAATKKPTPLADCKTQSRLTCLAGSCLKSKQPQAGKGNLKVEDQMMKG